MAEEKSAPQMQATLGLTGLTSNAMALIAPGAFLWLTFAICRQTPVSVAQLLLPCGSASSRPSCFVWRPRSPMPKSRSCILVPASSYYYAEQALLSKDATFKYARISKFIVGWGSHLYYWVYPGVMVWRHRRVFVGYVVGFLYPNFMSGSNPGPVFMALVAIVFTFAG